MRAQGLETRLHEVGDERTLGRGREDTGYVTKRHGVRDGKKRGVRDEKTRGRDERILGARAEGHGDQDGRTRERGDKT